MERDHWQLLGGAPGPDAPSGHFLDGKLLDHRFVRTSRMRLFECISAALAAETGEYIAAHPPCHAHEGAAHGGKPLQNEAEPQAAAAPGGGIRRRCTASATENRAIGRRPMEGQGGNKREAPISPSAAGEGTDHRPLTRRTNASEGPRQAWTRPAGRARVRALTPSRRSGKAMSRASSPSSGVPHDRGRSRPSHQSRPFERLVSHRTRHDRRPPPWPSRDSRRKLPLAAQTTLGAQPRPRCHRQGMRTRPRESARKQTSSGTRSSPSPRAAASTTLGSASPSRNTSSRQEGPR